MKTKRNLRIRNAVQMALAVGLASGLAAPTASAADEEAAQLERIQVTGSRISQLDVEGATPVVTISREDLDNSGFSSVADFLRSNSFNSFGSIREESGNTAQGQATLNLRGLGSNRTLILIDGARLPGSPVLDGQVQNLNTVPFAAVERIEILSDGASAIYGSDAIGGVVNIILRKDFEGGEITARASDPDRRGGAERGVSLVSGFGGDRGRVTFSLEADHKDILLSRDRDYLANQFLGGDANDLNNYSQISFNARNILDPVTFDARPMVQGNIGDENCSIYGDGFLPQILGDSSFPADRACMYDYTKVAAQTASLDRLSAFMDADYEINSDLTFNTQVLATRVQSFGRYAPTASGLLVWDGPDLPARTVTVGSQDYTLTPMFTGDYYFYRFNNTGPARDTWQNDYQFDLQTGLAGFYDGVQWNLNYQYDQYDLQEWGNGYVNLLGLSQAASNGWDPRDPNQEQFSSAVPSMRENANRRAGMVMQRVDVGAQFDGPMLGSGPVLFFVGGEYIDSSYFDETQAQAEAKNISGSSGGSSGGHRSNWAAFGEVSVPVADTVELSAAVRYDSYSDFGTNVSGKLGFRFQPVDYWLLRGSVGTGFRAPSLDELYQAPAFSASFAQDVVTCFDNNTAFVDCPTRQYDTFYSSNLNLDPEKSTQALLGTVLDMNSLNGTNVVLSADLYYTKIEDLITTLSNTDIYFAEYTGVLDQLEGYSVTRAANGRPVTTLAGPVNYGEIETTGLDLRANYGVSLGGAGDLDFGLQLNYIMSYDALDIVGGPFVDQLGRNGTPEYRMNYDISWVMGRHTVSLTGYFIPGQDETSELNKGFNAANPSTFFYTGAGEIDSYSNHNIMYSFEAPWNARIQAGVTNITDEDPVLDSFNNFDSDLYPVVSRAFVASYTQRF